MTIQELIKHKIYPRILDFTDVYGNTCWWFEIRSLKDYEQTLFVSEDLGYDANFETYDKCLEVAIKECLKIINNENIHSKDIR